MVKLNSSKRSITPSEGFFPCYLLGHAIRTELATGILHDIYVSSIVLDINDKKMIWISLELAGCDKEQSDQLRKELSLIYDIPVNQIIVSFTHTHSAPEYSDFSPFFGKEKAQVPGYWDYIYKQTLLCVKECFDKGLIEVDAYYKKTTIDGYYGNRNGLDKPCDKDLITVEFKHGEKIIAVIASFCCHPTVLGPQNREVDPDLAGAISREIEAQTGVYAFVMQGAAGDVSNRLYRQGNDINELNRVTQGIMQQFFSNCEQKKIDIDTLQVENYHYFDEWDIDVENLKNQKNEIEDKINHAASFDEKKVYISALAAIKNKMSETHQTLELDCIYIQMGDLAIFTMPAELFNSFGMRIKSAMNVPCALFWGYSNYSVGYLYNQEEVGNGFESAVSSLPIGTTERITDEIVDFIKHNQIKKEGNGIEKEEWQLTWKYKKTFFISLVLFFLLLFYQLKLRGLTALTSSGKYSWGILSWILIFVLIWRACVGFVMVIEDKRTVENELTMRKVQQFHKDNDLFTAKTVDKYQKVKNKHHRKRD